MIFACFIFGCCFLPAITRPEVTFNEMLQVRESDDRREVPELCEGWRRRKRREDDAS